VLAVTFTNEAKFVQLVKVPPSVVTVTDESSLKHMNNVSPLITPAGTGIALFALPLAAA
jgi:hypothetical protein